MKHHILEFDMKFDTPRVLDTFTEQDKMKISEKYRGRPIGDVHIMSLHRIYLRTLAAEAQNWKCCFCGCEMTTETDKKNSVTLEHIIPRSEGGEDTYENSAASCYKCNTQRGNMDGIEYYQMISSPHLLVGHSSVLKASKNRKRIEAKLRRCVKKARKHSEQNWKLCGYVQSFEDWKATLPISDFVKEELMVLLKEEGIITHSEEG